MFLSEGWKMHLRLRIAFLNRSHSAGKSDSSIKYESAAGKCVSCREEYPHWIHENRKREIEIIFSRCPLKLFKRGLELGGGDGYQSALLSRYIRRLLCTDINKIILRNRSTGAIQYKQSDAEKIGSSFGKGMFNHLHQHTKGNSGNMGARLCCLNAV